MWIQHILGVWHENFEKINLKVVKLADKVCYHLNFSSTMKKCKLVSCLAVNHSGFEKKNGGVWCCGSCQVLLCLHNKVHRQNFAKYVIAYCVQTV